MANTLSFVNSNKVTPYHVKGVNSIQPLFEGLLHTAYRALEPWVRKETVMVALDHGLVARARTLTTGANVHRANSLIFAYELAVVLHNKGAGIHVIYQNQPENELRRFVERETWKVVGGAA